MDNGLSNAVPIRDESIKTNTYANIYVHDDNKQEHNTTFNKTPDLLNNDIDDNESNLSVQSKKSLSKLNDKD